MTHPNPTYLPTCPPSKPPIRSSTCPPAWPPICLLQASLWNFVRYNVVGGGDSALYGVEGPTYYLRNGLNNFQALLPLALALPAVAAVAGSGCLLAAQHRGSTPAKQQRSAGAGSRSSSSVLALLACVSPLYVWMAAITALPHKEERFLYVAYPLVSARMGP